MPKNQNRKTLFPTIHWKALLAASLRAFVLFVIIDISLEYAIASLFAVNVKALMPRQDFGTLFLIAYYGIIWGGLFILLLGLVALARFRGVQSA